MMVQFSIGKIGKFVVCPTKTTKIQLEIDVLLKCEKYVGVIEATEFEIQN